MKVFVIAGGSGSGKGEVAKFIKEFYTYKLENVVVTEYGKYVKGFAQELSDWDGNPNTKPRRYLQELGDKIRRYDKKFFINRMIEDINVYEEFANIIVVEGARFPEEIEDIKLNFDEVYSIYVVNQHDKSLLSLEEQSHITETALENYNEFDYVLANDTMESLKDKVFKYLEGIK